MAKNDATITFRTSTELAQEVQDRADELGVTASDVIADAVCRYLGRSPLTKLQLVIALAALIDKNFDKKSFPADVTLKVFKFILEDPKLRRLYDEAIRGPDGVPDAEKRAVVHREIGRMVKRRLNAKVTGRSVPLDPKEHLIESHALLAPESP